MFCHLHTHSHYSRLDGLGTVKELVERAMELGQTALAITDHGNCSGLYDLMKYTEGTPVKPILGCEFYFNTKEDEKYSHLILLAKDQVGLTNIFKLHEYGYVHGFKMKPRINLEMLKKHSEGIVCLSACLGNIIPRALLEGDEDYAYEWAMTFKRIFGEDFYIELQDSSLDTQKFVNQKLVKLANKINVEIVATNDVHYTLKEDAEIHDTMLCMQTNAKKHNEKRWRFPSRDFWLKSEDEMTLTELSKEDRERALNNTMVIADKCNAKLIKGSYLPKFYNVPEGKTEERLLREEVTKRYKTEITDKGLHTKAYAEAVMKELEVIEQTGYSGYHLIVADFVNYARNNGILVGDGRGSGAGCKVAYIMGITRVEPEKHHLLFERFLAPGRIPDYDIDFADNNAIFSYLQDKYGVENVARIVAFGTLSAKAVARKVFSAFGHAESIIAQISGAIPSEVGITLDKAYSLSPDLVRFKKQYKEEFKHMERLEGRISHASQHAGGVIIYPNLSSYIPVHTDSEDRNKRIVSFDKKMAEDMGFCKIDCLGLEALSTLNETVKSIERLEGVAINFDEINYEDPAIYEDLRRGDVYGLFQLENQKELTIKQQPKCFDDIVAISSICRPGTCDVDAYLERRTKQNFTIPPQEEWYMRKSEGLIIYQEQFLLHCKTYAGWDIAFADKNVRKNKGLKTDVDLRNRFISDCVSNGYTHDFAMSKWQEIVDVAGGGYSFNASHAVSYSIITYRNAWLKHYYPVHFYASLLTKLYNDDKKKHLLPDVISECKARGIAILPPDINLSLNQFIPTKDGIRFALNSVKGLGESALEHLISLRPIHSLEDMITRAMRRHLRENVVDSLIKAGCFDNEIPNRYEMLLYYKSLINSKKEVIEKSNMEYEHEALGVYLQQHPMDKYSFKDFKLIPDNAECLIGGIVKEVREKLDKRGNKMAFITIETKHGNVSCLAFSSIWTASVRKVFSDNALVMIKGKRSGSSCIINQASVIQ